MLPEGEYNIRITGAEVRVGRARGTPYIWFKSVVTSEISKACHNQLSFAMSGITLANFPYLHEKLGIPVEPTTEDLQVMLGYEYRVRVLHKNWQNRTFLDTRLIERIK